MLACLEPVRGAGIVPWFGGIPVPRTCDPLPSLGGRVRATAQQIHPADTSYAPVFLIYCIRSVWLKLDVSFQGTMRASALGTTELSFPNRVAEGHTFSWLIGAFQVCPLEV